MTKGGVSVKICRKLAHILVRGPIMNRLVLQVISKGSPGIATNLASLICTAVASCSIISAVFVLGMSRRTQGHKGGVMLGYNE